MNQSQTVILIIIWAIAAILVRYLLFMYGGLIKLKKSIEQEKEYIEALIKNKKKEVEKLEESLKTTGDFLQSDQNSNPEKMQARINDIDERIARRKESYNDSVERFNYQLQRIPHRYFATMLGYEPKDPFK
jgi:hypothetical protein